MGILELLKCETTSSAWPDKELCLKDSSDLNYSYIPKNYNIPNDINYFHCTSNNTIFGTQIKDKIVENFDQCEDLCLEHPNCIEFLFKDRTTYNLCEIYSSVEEKVYDYRLGNIRGTYLQPLICFDNCSLLLNEICFS